MQYSLAHVVTRRHDDLEDLERDCHMQNYPQAAAEAIAKARDALVDALEIIREGEPSS